MSVLSKMQFVALPANAVRDVMGYKRKRAIARLEDQRSLLKNPSFTRTVKRLSGKKGDANRTKVEKAVRVTPCWRSLATGGFAVTLRLGNKMVEFKPGRQAVAAQALDQVDAILVAFQKAIQAGEFDEMLKPKARTEKQKLIAQAEAAARKAPPKRKVA